MLLLTLPVDAPFGTLDAAAVELVEDTPETEDVA